VAHENEPQAENGSA